jgi:hypothetical protein
MNKSEQFIVLSFMCYYKLGKPGFQILQMAGMLLNGSKTSYKVAVDSG